MPKFLYSMLCGLEKRRAHSFLDVDNFWLNLKARREHITTAWNTFVRGLWTALLKYFFPSVYALQGGGSWLWTMQRRSMSSSTWRPRSWWPAWWREGPSSGSSITWMHFSCFIEASLTLTLPSIFLKPRTSRLNYSFQVDCEHGEIERGSGKTWSSSVKTLNLKYLEEVTRYNLLHFVVIAHKKAVVVRKVYI